MQHLFSNFKSKFTAAFSALVLVLCSVFVFAGCSNELALNDAIGIAKEDFGCKKILWVSGAPARRTLTSDIKYTQDGKMYLKERIFPDQGGYYVFGLDKNGNDVYVAVPRYKSSSYKPAEIDWPFDYTFTQILDFAGRYGYKYVDGIDGRIDEFTDGNDWAMRSCGNENSILGSSQAGRYCESLNGTFCEKLDIAVVFEFQMRADDNRVYSYTIGQIDGKLMVMEIDFENDKTAVYTYNR